MQKSCQSSWLIINHFFKQLVTIVKAGKHPYMNKCNPC